MRHLRLFENFDMDELKVGVVLTQTNAERTYTITGVSGVTYTTKRNDGKEIKFSQKELNQHIKDKLLILSESPESYKKNGADVTAEDMFNDPKTTRIIKQDLDMDPDELMETGWIAETKNYKPDTYYRVEGTQTDYAGVGSGLYVGRDPAALKAFYDHEQNDLPVYEYKGTPNWLDLMQYDDYAEFNKEAKAKFGEHDRSRTDHLKQLCIERGYDGIRYYDVTATGEEFVLFNTKALKKIA